MEMSRTREHRFKVRGAKYKEDIGKFFTLKVGGALNPLPGVVLDRGRTMAFERLDKHMGLQDYGSCAGYGS